MIFVFISMERFGHEDAYIFLDFFRGGIEEPY